MSDFVSRDLLPDLWEDILRKHWTFLETEESMQKLEERKKLEDCLKKFLCLVPHDRKFFLPETAHVLKKSVREMDDFTAYKAMIGFDSISQYANNLFTKPWRKEYRVIKMYSGFYHHEIKSNLIDAEKLFEAMGYRLLSNQILVLDGPICPDQVTNVSRDAMAAYVECQIMKQVYAGLTTISLPTSWLDVFNYRETHTGGATQTMKGIAYNLQEKRFRKDKLTNSENCYATIQHNSSPQGSVSGSIHGGSSAQMVSSCPNCTRSSTTGAAYHQHSHQHHHSSAQHVNGCSIQSTNNSTQIAISHPYSSGHHQAVAHGAPQHSYVGSKLSHAIHAHGPNYSHMSHSRSLEHYNDQHAAAAAAAINGPPPLPHRHSFDQQGYGVVGHNIYDSPYDLVDGGGGVGGNGVPKSIAYAACNFNAYSHPYNVSGNRYPLPLNISNHLNGQYSCNGSGGASLAASSSNNALYASQMIAGCGHKMDSSATPVYADCNGFNIKQKQPIDAVIQMPSSPAGACNYHHHPRGNKDFQAYRQRSFPPDNQLIDFEERPTTDGHSSHSHLRSQQNNSFDYSDRTAAVVAAAVYDNRRVLSSISNRLNSLQPPMSSSYSGLPSYCNRNHQQQYHQHSADHSSDEGNYGYATVVKPTPRSRTSTDRNKLTEKYFRNSHEIIVRDYEKALILENNKKQDQHQHQQSTPDLHHGNNRTVIAVNGGDHHHHPRHQHHHRSIDSYNGFDEFPIAKSSSSQPNKNQDGVGSFESWDYVFQNLEKQGHSKDINEREDLFVQSLDLDSLNVIGSGGVGGGGGGGVISTTDKRRTNRNSEAKSRQLLNGNDASHQHRHQQKSSAKNEKTLETSSASASNLSTKSRSAANNGSNGKSQQHNSSGSITHMENGGSSNNVTTAANSNTNTTSSKAIKSALKQTTATPITANCDNNNDNDDDYENGGSGTHLMKNANHSSKSTRSASAASAANKSSRLTLSAGVSTQVIVSSPNEWSCRFCTFLNPDTKRICEMCCRSKDFNMEATNAPTCV